MQRGFDYDRRGQRPLWLWKTRSVRLMGVYLSQSTFVALDARYKKGPASAPWYKTCAAFLDEIGLRNHAFVGGDPHGEEEA